MVNCDSEKKTSIYINIHNYYIYIYHIYIYISLPPPENVCIHQIVFENVCIHQIFLFINMDFDIDVDNAAGDEVDNN